MARKKNIKPAKKRAIRPKIGNDTRADVEAALASGKRSAKEVTHLRRQYIQVAAQGVFQWRHYARNEMGSSRHVATLAAHLNQTKQAFEPLLVFPAGEKYYVIDGHHRLAAYEAVKWQSHIPVKVFEGTLDEALLRGLSGNNKNKLPMTAMEKSEAAWRLVKEGKLNRPQIIALTTTSRSTIGNMRTKLAEMKAADPEGDRSWQRDWIHARMWAPDGEQRTVEDDWLTKAAEKLVQRIVKAGIATELMKKPDVTALALSLINEHLPSALTREWGWEIGDWQQEKYHEDDTTDLEL
jgi:ParB-like chromosome segregation protein Spo0J